MSWVIKDDPDDDSGLTDDELVLMCVLYASGVVQLKDAAVWVGVLDKLQPLVDKAIGRPRRDAN
jgi:hypothetical protein